MRAYQITSRALSRAAGGKIPVVIDTINPNEKPDWTMAPYYGV
ncbi:MAG: hypothetical protein NTW52_03655 [Planctomycetota bacterium]|nr:hypothetical protein [Planctomycetota bacterium]